MDTDTDTAADTDTDTPAHLPGASATPRGVTDRTQSVRPSGPGPHCLWHSPRSHGGAVRPRIGSIYPVYPGRRCRPKSRISCVRVSEAAASGATASRSTSSASRSVVSRPLALAFASLWAKDCFYLLHRSRTGRNRWGRQAPDRTAFGTHHAHTVGPSGPGSARYTRYTRAGGADQNRGSLA